MDQEILFDAWNIQKKNLQINELKRFYREKEVWWVSLGKNIGSEQDGKGEFYDRPVLIIKSFSRSVCLIIPLTTSEKKNPYHVNAGVVENKQAYAIISQIKLIDTKRLLNKICTVDAEIFDEIRKTIRNLF